MYMVLPLIILLLALSQADAQPPGVSIGPLAQSIFDPVEGDDRPENFIPSEDDDRPELFLPEEGDSDPANFEPEDGDSNPDNFESPDLDELALARRNACRLRA